MNERLLKSLGWIQDDSMGGWGLLVVVVASYVLEEVISANVPC
jgi:hypothetical protein